MKSCPNCGYESLFAGCPRCRRGLGPIPSPRPKTVKKTVVWDEDAIQKARSNYLAGKKRDAEQADQYGIIRRKS